MEKSVADHADDVLALAARIQRVEEFRRQFSARLEDCAPYEAPYYEAMRSHLADVEFALKHDAATFANAHKQPLRDHRRATESHGDA